MNATQEVENMEYTLRWEALHNEALKLMQATSEPANDFMRGFLAGKGHCLFLADTEGNFDLRWARLEMLHTILFPRT